MKKLADAILDGEQGLAPWCEVYSDPSRLRQLIRSSPCIIADNVAEYLWAGTDQEEWKPGDFPNLAPPFKEFWIEFGKPTCNRSLGNTLPVQMPNRIGWSVESLDANGVYTTAPVSHSQDPTGLFMWMQKTLGARWFLLMHLYCSGERSGWIDSNCRLVIAVNHDGEIVDEHILVSYHPGDTDADRRRLWASGLSFPVCLAISFMHCKNADISDYRNASNRYTRAGRRSAHNSVVFKTLTIEPIRRVLASARSDGATLKQRLHICRGHFKDYRQSGLFGKVKGIFWWDSTVRGSSKQGVVAKDYDVSAHNALLTGEPDND